jgi:RNA polymerase subunit RPABC4/transcription elongation factor Spt4
MSVFDAPLDLTNAGAWVTGARIVGYAVAGYLAVLWIGLVAWTWRDIRARTRDGTMQAASVALVTVFFIPGMLLYLALRPQDLLVDAYNRRLEEEAFLHEIQKQEACANCRRQVSDDFIICPYCRTTLREACEGCSRTLASKWVACPYCGDERAASLPIPAFAQAPSGPRARPQREQRPRSAVQHV